MGVVAAFSNKRKNAAVVNCLDSTEGVFLFIHHSPTLPDHSCETIAPQSVEVAEVFL